MAQQQQAQVRAPHLAAIVEYVAKELSHPAGAAECWLRDLEKAGATTFESALALRQKRHLWHRVGLPVSARVLLDDTLLETLEAWEDQKRIANATAVRISKRDKRMSCVSATVLQMLSEGDGPEEAPVYNVSSDFGQLTKEEIFQTAKLIGMSVDAGAIDRITDAHVAEAGQEHCLFDAEELSWLDTVNALSQKVHTKTVARLYFCKQGETEWSYTGLLGGATVVTEANFIMNAAHYIRLIDVWAFDPNRAALFEQELYGGFKYQVLTPFFHAFETDTGMAGLSFADEVAADWFAEAIATCMQTDALELLELHLNNMERSYVINGEVKIASSSEEAKAKQQSIATGEISDGIQLSWKKTIPPEMMAALGGKMDSEPAAASPVAASPSGSNWKRKTVGIASIVDADSKDKDKKKKRTSLFFGKKKS